MKNRINFALFIIIALSEFPLKGAKICSQNWYASQVVGSYYTKTKTPICVILFRDINEESAHIGKRYFVVQVWRFLVFEFWHKWF